MTETSSPSRLKPEDDMPSSYTESGSRRDSLLKASAVVGSVSGTSIDRPLTKLPLELAEIESLVSCLRPSNNPTMVTRIAEKMSSCDMKKV